MFNDKQIKDIFTKYTYIVVDTREKKNEHIIKNFEKYNIKYIKKALKYGDYGIMIKANEEYGFKEDTILKVAVERKRDLNELGSNLTTYKKRFMNEMQRCTADGAIMCIAIEVKEYGDLVRGKYDNKIDKKAYLGLIYSLFPKYKVPFLFVEDKFMSVHIYYFLRAYAREYLKKI